MSITRICSGALECNYGKDCSWWCEYNKPGSGQEAKKKLNTECSGNKHKMVKCIYIIGHREDDDNDM
jgi:hypothetical protein